MSAINIIKRETLSNKKYHLENITLEKKDSKGELQRQEREIYHRPDGAAVLLYDLERRTVLLTQQFRLVAALKSDENDLLEACAGIIDPGESPEEAAKREAEEEVGYRVANVEKVYSAFATPGGVTETIHYFVAEYNETMKVNAGGGVEHEGEDIEIVELSFEEARKRLENQEFNDTKTIVLLQHLIIKGIL